MMKRTCLFVVFGLLLSVAALGVEPPVVLQPNGTNYTASQLATLNTAISTLETQLSNRTWASRRIFPTEWSSAQFAAYAAGILSGMGYKTAIVSGSGRPDDVHAWLLVGVPLEAMTGWIPVEACPASGIAQQILGTITFSYGATGTRSYDTRYLDFDMVVSLPPNAAPVAKIRLPMLPAGPEDTARFLALGSYDPDGEIVLYRWSFGDSGSDTSTSSVVYHKYKAAGSYAVSLTVVDDRGQSGSVQVPFQVIGPGQDNEPGGASGDEGCGCGK